MKDNQSAVKEPLPVPADAPDALRILVRRYGAAMVTLDAWEVANGREVRAMRKDQAEPYSDLLKAKADAKSAVRAAWHEWHGRDVPLPREWN